MFRRLALFLLPFATSWSAEFPTPTDNQPITNTPFPTPQESLAKFHLPPGFKATIFAAEPDVRNPIAMTWDAKGRLWIAENYTYSDAQERFDLKLRDRILIFEDVDNDGKFDKRTVFSEDLQMLTSVERGFGGVYALCPPNLLWIPDKDGDDKPDGPPQILLDGFSTSAASRHTFANGLKWGPDGWLYGRCGISSTSYVGVPGSPEDKRPPTAGGIWRYHPTRKVFEPYCHGTTNPWGMDWDKNGELFFINTVIGHLWHAIPGAHYKRMHGEDPYPHVYEQIDQHADHYHWDTGKKWTDSRSGQGVTDSLGGGHAHIGMMIYQGTNWPKEYRDKLFTVNMHGRRVNVERLERQGSGYVGKHEPDILKTDDTWFRGVEIQYGPDGGVYILDWSDVGECHENDGVHRTSGRIYKITYGDPVKPKEADLTKLTDAELVKLQLSDNEWLARMARWEMRERVYNKKSSFEDLTVGQLLGDINLVQSPGESLGVSQWLVRFQAAMVALGMDQNKQITLPITDLKDFGEEASAAMPFLLRLKILNQPSEVIAANFGPESKNTGMIEQITREEKSPAVRLTWASILQVLPTAAKVNAARGLLTHAEDATDHNLPLMYWYGIRDLPSSELVKLVSGCEIPLVRQFIARRVTEDIEKDAAPLNVLLEGAPSGKELDVYATDVLTGMTTALKGWRKAKKPEAWDTFVAKLDANNVALQTSLRDLNVLFGDGRALDEVRVIALDENATTDARRAALQTLIEAKSPDLRKVSEKLLYVQGLSLSAVQGLLTFDDPALAKKIVDRYRNFYPHERAAVVAALASRPSFAKVLLEQVAAGKIPRTDLTPTHARQIRSFNDEKLTQQLNTVWGELRESSEDKKELIAAIKAKLTKDVLAKADQSQGRLIYSQVCAMCHKLYGEGAPIGPDLTGSGRHDLTYLLENIADPSGMVATDFKMNVITLKDGRVLNGIIHGQDERTLKLTMIGMESVVDRNDIVKQEQLPISMMPEGLLMALSEDQVRDLMAYLMGNSQVPLPSP